MAWQFPVSNLEEAVVFRLDVEARRIALVTDTAILAPSRGRRWMCESVFLRSLDLGEAGTLPALTLDSGEDPPVLIQRALLEYPDRTAFPWLHLDFGSPFGVLRCRIESFTQRFKLLRAEAVEDDWVYRDVKGRVTDLRDPFAEDG